MRKIVTIAAIFALAVGLTACGGKNTQNSQSKQTESTKADENINISTADIEKKISETIGKDNYLCDTDITVESLCDTYGFNKNKILSCTAKQNSMTSLNMDTVIILNVADGYADSAVSLINNSYAQTVSYIRQYPFGTAKVLGARLYSSNNYVVFILAGASYDGEDSEAEAKLAYTEYAKIDKCIEEIFGSLPENRIVVTEKDADDSFDMNDLIGG